MGEATVHHLETPVTGRYLVRPAADGVAGPLLVGFHGYAESAVEHLEALRAIPGVEAWHLVAVQALHSFYRGRTGEIGASWMTSLDRERAIADNLHYVGSVLARVRDELPIEGPMVAIGFSQGTAMAYRAVAGSGHAFDAVVALGGDLPVDAATNAKNGFPPVLIGRGTEDEWYSAEKLAAGLERLDALGVAAETSVFTGGHEWTAEFYQACGRFLNAL